MGMPPTLRRVAVVVWRVYGLGGREGAVSPSTRVKTYLPVSRRSGVDPIFATPPPQPSVPICTCDSIGDGDLNLLTTAGSCGKSLKGQTAVWLDPAKQFESSRQCNRRSISSPLVRGNVEDCWRCMLETIFDN